MNYKLIADSLKKSLINRKKLLLTAVTAIGLATTTTAQTVPSYVPSNGLVGWWPFNGNANDESGNGNNGAVNGATLTTDRFGNTSKAYSFDGINNWIQVEDASTLRPGYLTLASWVYANNNAENPIITKTRIGNPNGPDGGEQYLLFYSKFNNQNTAGSFQIKRNGGCVNGGVGWNRITQNNLSFGTGGWHHITATYDGLIMKLYIDGQLSGIFNPPSGLIDNCVNGSFNIGRSWPNNSSFNGKIDDIGIWNRALTQQEITDLYKGNICYQNVTVTDTLRINTTITGFNPVTYQNSIKIWPNPTKDHITIDNGNIANLTGHQIKISNALGQQVFQSAINQKQFYVDMSSWGGHGIYFVNIINAQGVTIETKKIVLE